MSADITLLRAFMLSMLSRLRQLSPPCHASAASRRRRRHADTLIIAACPAAA